MCTTYERGMAIWGGYDVVDDVYADAAVVLLSIKRKR